MAGDFNGDGQLDLAVANDDCDDTVSVLLGNGDGTFQPQVTYAVGVGPGRHRGGRLHRRRPARPGRRQQSGGDVSVLLGNGDGTFQPQVTYAVGTYPIAIVAGDFTGDGRLDLAVVNYELPTTCRCCWATATARSNHSTERRTRSGRPRTPSWRGTSPATAASTWPSPTTADDTVSVLLGNGDGTFQPQVTYAVGSVPIAIVAGDFNGDGRLDLAVANDGRERRVGAAGQRRRHVPAPGHRTRSGVGPDAHRGG